MARKSIVELETQATVDFADNIIGAITPAKLRNWCLDVLNAIRPAYALMGVSGTQQVVNITPSLVTMGTYFDSQPTETTSANSSITRTDRGTSTINVDCDIQAPNGRFITFTLYKDGVALEGDVTVNGAGTNNPVAGSFTWTVYSATPAVYDLRVSCEVDGTTVTLSDVSMLLSIVPVNSYT